MSKGKSCETFNPLGPWLVPAADVRDPGVFRLRRTVNGEARQDSTTADLIWHLSQFMVLEPGDVLNTGTPQGVAMSRRIPYLTAGDTMELTVERVGTQRQRNVSWDAAL